MNQSRPVTESRQSGGSGDLTGTGVDRSTRPRGRHAARNTKDRPDRQKDDFPTEPALIAEDIARTRRELGETLEALSARMDVKSRARDGMTQARAQMVEAVRPVARPMLGALAGAGLGALVMGLVILMRRRGLVMVFPLRRRGRGRR
ncbi:MAG: DUF3618 domain-containing protein [Micromonosporaceae bacterium]